MKNRPRLIALIVAVAMMSVSVLTGCGGSGSGNKKEVKETATVQEAQTEVLAEAEVAKEETATADTSKSDTPTAEDAKAYVKAVLDILCTGDYDHSIKLSDIEEGKETELRDQSIQGAIDAIASDSGLNEEVQADFTDAMLKAFSKTKYTVGEAVPTEDGGYDVTVTVEPLKLYAGAKTKLPQKITAEDAAGLSEEKLNNLVFSTVADIIRENLEDPQYDEPQDIVLHYGLLDKENNLWGVGEEDAEKIAMVLFSADME